MTNLQLLFLLSAVMISAVVSEMEVATVVSSMTATFREYRYTSPVTISDVMFQRILGTTPLVPTAIGAVSSSLPPHNLFQEWPGAFITAVGNNSMTLFLPFVYTSTTSPKLKIVAAYHILPEFLAFSDLVSKRVHDRLPTLVPRTSIVVTSIHPRLTLDGVEVVMPDLFLSSTIAIHGIASPLVFTRNGGFDGGEAVSSSFLILATATVIVLACSFCFRSCFFRFL